MKKFLAFFTVTVMLFGAAFVMYWRYVRQSECMVFVESFGNGVITVDSNHVTGSDEKYKVRCENGETLTLNINPERTDTTYYNLKKLLVNGEDITKGVKMLEYKIQVKKKLNILVYFEEGERPDDYKSEVKDYNVTAPEIDRYAENSYLGSFASYDIKDPCVFYDEESKTYYCFGSDNVVISSSDMVNWTGRTTYFKSPEDAASNSIMDFSAFESVKKWASEHGYGKDLTYSDKNEDRTPLAPEIVKIDGTYYLYFSVSKISDANESAIFCVTTDNLAESIETKSWNDGGLVISTCGRHAGNEIVEQGDGDKGKVTYKASYDSANAVHPAIIDTDNGLFMVYGGYWGRKEIKGQLNLVELSRSTGLIKAQSSYNKGELVSTLHGSSKFQAGTVICNPGRIPALTKNDGSLVSGADILYNKDTGYFYLFVTYGTAESNYNVRVGRSKKIDGPYLDYNGESLSDYSSSSRNNQYSKGFMLLSGYSFVSSSSGVGSGNIGRASIGSPSVVLSAQGDCFVATQSQLYYRLGGQITTGASLAQANELDVLAESALDIRELTWTNDGWPMAMPEIYAGENAVTKIKKSDLYGNWDVVILDSSADSENYKAVARSISSAVTVLENATITQKDIEKNKKLNTENVLVKNGNAYSLTIDGVEYTIYPCVVWDWELERASIVFTGVGSDSSTVWGKKNFSDAMGIYTDAFYYLLDMCDETVRAKYEKKIKKISSNPSQSQIDSMTSALVKVLTAEEK